MTLFACTDLPVAAEMCKWRFIWFRVGRMFPRAQNTAGAESASSARTLHGELCISKTEVRV